jgi:hypothetical protein
LAKTITNVTFGRKRKLDHPLAPGESEYESVTIPPGTKIDKKLFTEAQWKELLASVSVTEDDEWTPPPTANSTGLLQNIADPTVDVKAEDLQSDNDRLQAENAALREQLAAKAPQEDSKTGEAK